MKFIYPVVSIPAENEIVAVLRPVDLECAEIDFKLYRLPFGQYFWFDISIQLPFFFKCVQNKLVGLCRELSGLWQRNWPDHLSLKPTDPVLIHSRSSDRCDDSLVETCAVMTAYRLVELVDGSAVQKKYREFTPFFKSRWASTDELPVIETSLRCGCHTHIGNLVHNCARLWISFSMPLLPVLIVQTLWTTSMQP